METQFSQNLQVWTLVMRATIDTDFWVTSQHFIPTTSGKLSKIPRVLQISKAANYDHSFTFEVNYALQSNHTSNM